MTQTITKEDKCIHHWLIESPNGNEYLRSVCKKCGEEKYLKAATDDVSWSEYMTIATKGAESYY